ncbi:MAG TPA: DUF3488 and transglutaminase-like domain-containing protein [Pyrinomonadaceae bacterium]|nr:DUF3488 and transglutaminase-like domain-containing protein [Pyrinomonadaceae bacterium]
MNFDRFFRSISYLTVLCGFMALWASGTFGVVSTGLFLSVMVVAWLIEGKRWQLSERVGTTLIVLAIPFYYLAFEFGWFSFTGTEALIGGILARLILTLSAIKLLQNKGDRDWVFLYLMTFFEVLLAAGLSISLGYLAALAVFVVTATTSVIALDIKKTTTEVAAALNTPEKLPENGLSTRRLPAAAILIVIATAIVAAPTFFFLPRVGGAGLGGMQRSLSTMSGFSDRMQLGAIGRIQQNEAVVMRVRHENETQSRSELYFRGIALDTFDNRTWSASKAPAKQLLPNVDGRIELDQPRPNSRLAKSTIYLEPLDTPVLFAAPKAMEVGTSMRLIFRDITGDLSYQPMGERISYTVTSDVSSPVQRVRLLPDTSYDGDSQKYLKLPDDIDPKIGELAHTVVGDAKTRYDRAVAIENHLLSNYGYSLEMRAGGEQPVADFLFNVREGHCEYFASAMTLMLRSQGIAARVVTGFSGGDVNEKAGLRIVRQRNAHAWVEAYFPQADAWVTFDPTPPSNDSGMATGFMAEIGSYLEAIDAIWIQYFVAFDQQEQQSMSSRLADKATSLSSEASSLIVSVESVLKEWWWAVKGRIELMSAPIAIGLGIVALSVLGIVIVLTLRIYCFVRAWARNRKPAATDAAARLFEKMETLLKRYGITRQEHQTPMEFAVASGIPEAIELTDRYQYHRFGGRELTKNEALEFESLIAKIKTVMKQR